ncbi:hypothetical protein OAN24_06210 [Pseudodesulfovibrio sp.]|nr:hypothetical protein [Pseudodesulfovibrio sp.]
MRTIVFTLMLLLALTACGGKEDVSTDPNGEAAASETTADEAGEESSEAAAGEEAPAEETASIAPDIILEPIGEIHLFDGTVLELTTFEKIGKYYIYIAGKLNGRSSTVLSLTRLDDLQNFAGIGFKDQHNFTIVTKAEKELHFEGSRVYIGSDSPDTYTFFTTDPDTFQMEKVDVKKKDVKLIVIK